MSVISPDAGELTALAIVGASGARAATPRVIRTVAEVSVWDSNVIRTFGAW